ncbi:hypothetical protein [Hyperthermus butylicus]|uniref:Uncharacterized protein n=1 Tax=Hyperthermus butylicus (strain DSM 5456 / JCM 9403 / PLM1-5) TaxID=415426 RepID=A2BJ72_HYPBU|nr:hypothetical protein [Hyperthermus butylicus]ABM80033.1 hypothetical protein Hbut_0161 [Hyperthermus butylicus DSM 5456]
MGKQLVQKALSVVRRYRVVSPELLEKELGVDKGTAEMLIAVLLAQGYLRELSGGGNPCQYCPLARICTPGKRRDCPLGRSGLRLYLLARRDN